MFGDRDWPLGASHGFVSISWASCIFTVDWQSKVALYVIFLTTLYVRFYVSVVLASVDSVAVVVHVYMCLWSAQLNQNVNAFQRKFVNEVRRCEEMERKLRTFGISFPL